VVGAHGVWQPGAVDRRAWSLILLLASLWGASYFFIKVALDDLGPVAIVFARTLLGAAVLAPVAIRRRAFAPVRAHLGTLVFVAVVQIAIPFLLISGGETHISSSLAGILVASAPIFTAIIAVLVVQEERLPRRGLVGVAIGMAGVVMLFGVDLGGDTLLGGGMVLLAGLGYAVGALTAKRRLAAVPPVGLVASVLTISALAMVPLLPFNAPGHAPGLDTVAALLALGCGGTGAAFLVFYVLNAEIGPGRASIVAYVAPVFSIVYGVTLLDESFTAGTAAGLALILAGSWLAADGRVPRLDRRARPWYLSAGRSIGPAVTECRVSDDITLTSMPAAATATGSSRPTASSTSSPPRS
jgi:drug/metabolite transporter (DMT)-like permease